jgi:hypothetical protein
MFKVFRYTARPLLEHPQMTNGLFSQFRFACGGNPGMNPDFQITIQVLIRIELGRVGRQVEHLNLLKVLFQPLVNQFAVMYSQVVDDQEPVQWLVPAGSFQCGQRNEKHLVGDHIDN